MAKTSHNQGNGLAADIGKRTPFTSLRQEAYLNLVRTHEHLSCEFTRLLKKHGLSDSQYNALRILRGEGKPMQTYQIAERMITSQTDISRLVDRLEASELVERERSAEDRRVVWVSLTDKGRAILKKLDKPVSDLHEKQFEGFSDEQLKSLVKLLYSARSDGSGKQEA
ncbi:MarR family transcriptional regulator [Blastopirellula sp. JC732]|uniref:MarR family transcriptional regulator n=1 Tax=Blastopirellula sediminis TaxID=2894196 RepID=A0A9X1SI57_9BACT|nr:MarR family transcriptional regulator [Blastopirellula sediminis]MCC9605773.1 MarR family transcriptional regulator [Blastopirellula sediminis]MCC9630927.1 MarR family transcriptional regulator [Blastopirellula sediminis]